MNLPLAATGQIWHSYDFSTHVFFASHYQRSWWSLWEPRWFEGFDVASYPPLTHQLAALLGWLIGIENSVNVLTASSVLVFPLGLYALVRQQAGVAVGLRSAAIAIVTPSVLLAAYAFGQLPTLFALDAALLAGAALVAYLRGGGAGRLPLVIALGGVVVATHHATMLFFLAPLFGAVACSELLRAKVPTWLLARRVGLAGFGTGFAAILVILPFWVWHATEYVAQVPIDHQSRHNYLADALAQDQFFWAEHGVLVAGVILAPVVLRGRFRLVLPWYVLALLFLLLGMGGTTPLPRLIFGGQWEWLTYDRFSLWADVPLVLLFGMMASRWLDGQSTDGTGGRGRDGSRPAFVQLPVDGNVQFKGVVVGVGDQDEAVRELPLHEPAQWSGRRTACRVAWGLTLGWLATFSVLDALLPELIQAEPAPIDPRPIVAFLATHGRDADGQPRWRYLTLGFGEQSGLVQAHTEAGTVDGYFYTARRLPLLTQSGIASLDFSLLWDPEAATLQKLLSDPATHGLRWVFTRDAAYEPFLSAAGWQKGEPLANGVTVWEANGAIPPVLQAAPGIGPLGIWWGITPLAALAASLLLGWWMRPKKVLGPGRGRRDN